MKNKRGVSPIIAYVLLIVIVISISLLVYAFLKGQIPKETSQCPDNTALVISDYDCQVEGEISLILHNKGLFYVNGAIIKVSEEEDSLPIHALGEIDGYNTFTDNPDNKLNPGEKYEFIFIRDRDIVEIEIIPVRIIDNELILCDKASFRQKLEGC